MIDLFVARKSKSYATGEGSGILHGGTAESEMSSVLYEYSVD